MPGTKRSDLLLRVSTRPHIDTIFVEQIIVCYTLTTSESENKQNKKQKDLDRIIYVNFNVIHTWRRGLRL